MKSKVTSLLFLLLLFPVMSVMGANPFTVKGTVTDTSGDPLVGVSVIIQGTAQGTQTNIDGEFSIKASEGQTLRLTYIGYRTVEHKVQNDAPLKIVMIEESTALDEVVVTARTNCKKVC